MDTRDSDYTHWYEQTYPHLTGQGLWLRGEGLNVLPRAQFGRRPCRVLIARLSSWRDTGASLSHRVVYRIAAGVDGVFPDLAYLPPPQDRALFERDRVPWLLGAVSKAGPSAFQCVAFSNATVQELVNLPHMLSRSGIPLRTSERLARADVPLVILGGANAAAAAGLLAGDSLADGVFVGGAEAAIAALLATLRDCVTAGLDKSETLGRLAGCAGFVRCGEGRPATPSPAASGPEPALGRAPVWAHEEQMGTGHVVLTDGCPYGCAFCFECWMHRPYREHTLDQAEQEALAAKAALAADNLELYGYSVNSHRQFGDVLCALAGIAPSVGLKSQRPDVLAREPSLPGALRAIGKASLTVGVEGISERLRNYLDKRLPETLLREGLAAILDTGARELKVFLIATGLEQKADFEELSSLFSFIRERIRAGDRRTRVIVSVTPLVCFPWTPLEFADAPSEAELRSALKWIGVAARAVGFEYRESAGPDEQFVSQVLARPCDTRVAEVLVECSLAGGFVYDREVTRQYALAFAGRLNARGLTPAVLLTGFGPASTRERPWTAVDPGLDRTMLAERFRACATALSGRAADPGERPAAIGQAVTAQHVRALASGTRRRREQTREVAFLVDIAGQAAGLPRRMAGLALAQAIMAVKPGLARAYDGYRGSLWATGDDPCWVTGGDVLTLAWQEDGALRLQSDTGLAIRAGALLGEWGTLKGVWAAGQAKVRWLAFASPYACDPDRFFRETHLKATRRRAAEGYEYEFAPQSLKNDIVRALAVRALPEGGSEARVEAGDALVVEQFLRTAFVLPSPADWVRTRVRADLDCRPAQA